MIDLLFKSKPFYYDPFDGMSSFVPRTEKSAIFVEPILPTRGTKQSVGFDFATPYAFYLDVDETKVVELGLIWQPASMDHCMLILSRSGLSTRGITVANAPGLIDLDYTGPDDTLKIILHRSKIGKMSDGTPMTFKPGDRIAQGVLVPYGQLSSIGKVEQTATTESRGGLGSTGA